MSDNEILFEGIILAAGFSSRMKEWKPEIKIFGLPLIIHTVKPMLDHCRRIIVVGGFNIEKLKKIFTEESYLSSQQQEKISVIKNTEFSAGMFSSVKRGLSEIQSELGAFIIPGDIPSVKSSTYSSLIKSFKKDHDYQVFIPVSRVNDDMSLSTDMLRKGHPVLLRKEIMPSIVSMPDSMNLRDTLEQFSIKLCRVDDIGIFTDVDDKEDLEKIKVLFGGIKKK